MTSRLIDFVNTSQDIHTKSSITKSEILYLAAKTGSTISTVLTLETDISKAYGNFYDPSVYPQPASITSTEYDAEFAKRLIGLPYDASAYSPYDYTNPLLLIHQVMFNGLFTYNSLVDQVAVDFILAQSKNNYWPNSYITYLDWVAECGIALKCLGEDLGAEESELLEEQSTRQITWEDYHPLLTYELYKVI